MSEELTNEELAKRTEDLANQDIEMLKVIGTAIERLLRLEASLRPQLQLLLLMNARVSRIEESLEPVSIEAVLDGKPPVKVGMTEEEIDMLEQLKTDFDAMLKKAVSGD